MKPPNLLFDHIGFSTVNPLSTQMNFRRDYSISTIVTKSYVLRRIAVLAAGYFGCYWHLHIKYGVEFCLLGFFEELYHQCSSGLLVCCFLRLSWLCLALVLRIKLVPQSELDIFPPLQFFGRVWRAFVRFFFTCLVEFPPMKPSGSGFFIIGKFITAFISLLFQYLLRLCISSWLSLSPFCASRNLSISSRLAHFFGMQLVETFLFL